MKTQINTLVSGSLNVIGTPHDIRNNIANKVHEENREGLKIRLNENVIELAPNISGSGKTITYIGEFPLELYYKMFGTFGIPKKDPQAFIIINHDLTVNVQTNSKFKNSGKQGYQRINESEITIL